jgi:hypothetical protein
MLVSRDRVVRSVTAPVRSVDDRPQPGAALAALLDALPRRRFRKPRVVIALGPAFTQTRHLSRLPALSDARALASIVRTNVSRFFLKNGVPLATSGVQVMREGEGWACAVEQPLLEELVAVCRARRLRLEMLVPALATLPYASRERVIRWSEDDIEIEGRYAPSRHLSSLRRSPGRGPEPQRAGGCSPAATDPGLWAATLGAARIPRSDPLAVRLMSAEPIARWRLVVACTALSVASMLGLGLPIVAQQRAASTAKTQLDGLARERGAAVWTERELALTTTRLAEIAAFARSRRSATLFLAELTGALADDVSLVSLRLDDSGGSLIALAPRAVAVVSQLGDVPDIADPSIVGAVTPDALNGERLERVTLRFRWRRAASAPPNARAGKEGR